MEILGGLIVSLVALVLLAGVGVMTLVALASMMVLGFLTEMSFRRVFFVSFGIGLLAPILLGLGISGAIADGSLEREFEREIGESIQLPPELGEDWSERLRELQEISREREAGTMTDEEAEQRLREIFSGVEDLQIGIDIDGDGNVTIGNDSDSGVPLDIPEPVEVGEAQETEGQ